MGKRAIVVVDIQNEYFAGGNVVLVGIEAAAVNAARVIADARARGDLVVNILHEAPSGPVFTAGSEGAKIHASVAPAEGEPVVVKNYPNSFRETGLKTILDGQGVDEVVIIGAMSHMCIDATARAASDFGYKTTIVQDACATLDLEFAGVKVPAAQVHAAIMAALAYAYGAVVGTDELIG